MLKQQQVKPHWMFALDNLLRQAVQDAITVLLPGKAGMHLMFSCKGSIFVWIKSLEQKVNKCISVRNTVNQFSVYMFSSCIPCLYQHLYIFCLIVYFLIYKLPLFIFFHVLVSSFLFIPCLPLLFSSHHPPLCVSELKLQLQSSFEIEDSTPEEQSADPDTPVVLVPDQLMEPADTQHIGLMNEIPATACPSSLKDIVFNSNCPLSENLKDLRLETRR